MTLQTGWSPSDLAQLSGGVWMGSLPGTVYGIGFDTRSLRPGDLFLALRGESRDGHAYLAEARSRGAVAAMVDREVDAPPGFPLLKVDDVRSALGRLAVGHRKARVRATRLAVTGSVGKTTVKELLANMLSTRAPTIRSQGNWNNDLGLPLTLLATEPHHQFGVYEVGMNHPGELDPLCAILAPQMGLVTGVGPVHLEAFESVAGIAEEKAAVCRCLPPDGLAVLPADDPWFTVLRDHAPAPVCTVSMKEDGGDVVVRRNLLEGWMELVETSSGETCRMAPALPGEYFALDAGLAAAAARACGVGWSAIAEVIASYQPLALRWERHEVSGLIVINDAYNANPVSMRSAMSALAEESGSGQLWVVLGGMLELGRDEQAMHRDLGIWIADHVDAVLIAVGERAGWIADGAEAHGLSRIYRCPHPEAAADLLAEQGGPGDRVLLKGSRGEAIDRVLTHWKTNLTTN
jgi:UDP-N-acetylmuramoyl-tripeptide--D-alanyl-D-alanine ligase